MQFSFLKWPAPDPSVNPMHDIVFVIWCNGSFGGMERRYVRLADHLAKEISEREVVIFAQFRSRDMVQRFLPEDTRVKVVTYGSDWSNKRKARNIIGDITSLWHGLSQFKEHHVHVCGNPGPITSAIALMMWKKSSKSASMVDLTFGFNVGITKKIHTHIINRMYDRIDCLSEETRDIILGISPNSRKENFRVAPCSFTDYSNIQPEKPRDIDVSMLARFVEHKGHDLLEKIHDEIKYLNVHVCGYGPLQFNMDSFFLYETDVPLAILSRSKIFLSLQSTNNYPSQSVLEAMASGCAIIASDVGETRKFLDDGCAILIPYNAHALREAIERLMKDPGLRRDLGQRAKERVFKEHTIERYARYFMDEIVDLHYPHHYRP